MKIKKIKLLKALAMTGAFGIVATVPVIVSACSSTSENNGGSGDNNQGGTGGNGSGGDTQQQTTVKPEIKTDVELSGKLSSIYDTSTTDRKNTNALIVEDIKANPENYFSNGADFKEAIKDANVTVDGGFSSSAWNEGDAYSTWSTNATKVTYPAAAKQIDISSLDALKNETFKDSDTIQTFLTDASLNFSNTSNFAVANQLGLTDGDLLHINITATRSQSNGGNLNLDLQIPVSNINLKTILKVSVGATDNTTGNKIEAATDLQTNFTYNIGIDSTNNFVNPTTAPTVTSAEVTGDTAAATILQKLGYVDNGTTNLSNDKISAALGIYNCKFTPKSATEKTDAGTPSTGNKVYTVTITAEPYDATYVWDDGSIGTKDITIDVNLTVN